LLEPTAFVPDFQVILSIAALILKLLFILCEVLVTIHMIGVQCNYFLPKREKKMAIFYSCLGRKIRKTPVFRRQLAKIAESGDHNINPGLGINIISLGHHPIPWLDSISRP
jgi:hypothetical protein